MSRRKSPTANHYQRAELIQRKKKRNPAINYQLHELHNIAQDKFMFLSLILANKWMEAIYMGNTDYDQKLHFIRTWYNANKPGERKELPKFDGQNTLF
jgi:hypothetical protein